MIRENKISKEKCPMPDIFALLVSNPFLEKALLSNDPSTRDSEDLKILKKKSKSKRDILYQLVVDIKTSKAEMNIEFMFNNFRVIANERTIEKLVRIIFEIIGTLDRKDNQLERLKQEYLKYSASTESQEVGPLKTNFQFVNSEQERGIFQSLMKVRETYLIKEKKVKVIKLERLEEKKRMSIEGKINNIEVWVPLDWNEKGSKHMSFAFSADIKHETYNHKDYYINNLTNLIFKVDEIDNVMDTQAILKKMIVKIEHFTYDSNIEETIESALVKSLREDLIKATLLKCQRIDLVYGMEEKPQDREGDANLALTIEPIDVDLGFIAINDFKTVFYRLMNIVDTVSEQNKHIISKIQNDYNEILAKAEESSLQQNRGEVKIISKLTKKKKINTLKMMMSLDQVRASLIDDIGLYHQQLLSFRLDAINCTLTMENGMEDPSSYILRKLGIYEYPYLEGKFSINACSKYYNFESGAEEPLIENWELHGSIRKAQPNSFAREGIISLKSDGNFNINLTYGIALVIKKTMDQMLLMNKKNELIVEESKKESQDNEEEILEFTNNLGCDLELIVEGYQDMIAKGGTPADFGYFSPTIDIPSNAAAV